MISLQREFNKFLDVVEKANPDCIYIHLGINDILNGTKGKDLAQYYYDLADFLLNRFRSAICFSLLIPTKNDENLNAKIRFVNWEITNVVSFMRDNAHGNDRNRVFTYDNHRIGVHCTFTRNRDRKPLLNDRGYAMLWMRLAEGIKKALRMPRPSYTNKSLSNHRSITTRAYD